MSARPARGAARTAASARTPRSGGRHPDPGKRERIIDAAAGLFGGRDLAGVRMEEVAARAGVAKGTVYLYFRSKEDLYFSILAARLSLLLDALDQAFREEEDPQVRLRKFLVHSSMFLLKYPDFFRMMQKEPSRPVGPAPAPGHDVEPLRTRLRDLLRLVLRRGMETGRIRVLPEELAVDLVFGTLEGAVRRCLDEGCTPQRHNQAPSVLSDFVWRALGTEAPPARTETSEPERLDGAVVAITREEIPGEGLAAEIIRLGGTPLAIQVVRTEPPTDARALGKAARAAADYDWILFTSARGVERFAAARAEGSSIPATTRIGAVGPATAQRAQALLGRCDCTASEASGAGLARELLRRETLRGTRVLLVRAEDGQPDAASILNQAGALLDEVVAYRTSPAPFDPAPVRAALRDGGIDAVAFASPSAARAFIHGVGADWLDGSRSRSRIVTIGKTTTAAVREFGLEPATEAEAPSLSELARAVARAVRTNLAVPTRKGARS